jgi:hypothetical protein
MRSVAVAVGVIWAACGGDGKRGATADAGAGDERAVVEAVDAGGPRGTADAGYVDRWVYGRRRARMEISPASLHDDPIVAAAVDARGSAAVTYARNPLSPTIVLHDLESGEAVELGWPFPFGELEGYVPKLSFDANGNVVLCLDDGPRVVCAPGRACRGEGYLCDEARDPISGERLRFVEGAVRTPEGNYTYRGIEACPLLPSPEACRSIGSGMGPGWVRVDERGRIVVAVARHGGHVHVLDRATGRQARLEMAEGFVVHSFLLAPGGRTAVLLHEDGRAVIVDTLAGTSRTIDLGLRLPLGPALRFDVQGMRLTVDVGSEVRTIDLRRGRLGGAHVLGPRAIVRDGAAMLYTARGRRVIDPPLFAADGDAVRFTADGIVVRTDDGAELTAGPAGFTSRMRPAEGPMAHSRRWTFDEQYFEGTAQMLDRRSGTSFVVPAGRDGLRVVRDDGRALLTADDGPSGMGDDWHALYLTSLPDGATRTIAERVVGRIRAMWWVGDAIAFRTESGTLHVHGEDGGARGRVPAPAWWTLPLMNEPHPPRPPDPERGQPFVARCEGDDLVVFDVVRGRERSRHARRCPVVEPEEPVGISFDGRLMIERVSHQRAVVTRLADGAWLQLETVRIGGRVHLIALREDGRVAAAPAVMARIALRDPSGGELVRGAALRRRFARPALVAELFSGR